MKKIFLFIAGVYVGIILFLPKDNLYYTLQDYLKKEDIFINSSINSFINLHLNDGKIYVNKIKIAKFKKISLYPFIFVNFLKGDNIKLEIKNYKINISAFFTPFYPVIFITGKGSFGDIKGKINLIKRYAKIYISNPKSLINFLKKDKKGYFYYAKF